MTELICLKLFCGPISFFIFNLKAVCIYRQWQVTCCCSSLHCSLTQAIEQRIDCVCSLISLNHVKWLSDLGIWILIPSFLPATISFLTPSIRCFPEPSYIGEPNIWTSAQSVFQWYRFGLTLFRVPPLKDLKESCISAGQASFFTLLRSSYHGFTAIWRIIFNRTIQALVPGFSISNPKVGRWIYRKIGDM